MVTSSGGKPFLLWVPFQWTFQKEIILHFNQQTSNKNIILLFQSYWSLTMDYILLFNWLVFYLIILIKKKIAILFIFILMIISTQSVWMKNQNSGLLYSRLMNIRQMFYVLFFPFFHFRKCENANPKLKITEMSIHLYNLIIIHVLHYHFSLIRVNRK